VPAMSKLELLRWVPAAYRGEHLRHPRIKYFQASRISISSPERVEAIADGEYLQDLPLVVEAVPKALQVMVPARES